MDGTSDYGSTQSTVFTVIDSTDKIISGNPVYISSDSNAEVKQGNNSQGKGWFSYDQNYNKWDYLLSYDQYTGVIKQEISNGMVMSYINDDSNSYIGSSMNDYTISNFAIAVGLKQGTNLQDVSYDWVRIRKIYNDNITISKK